MLLTVGTAHLARDRTGTLSGGVDAAACSVDLGRGPRPPGSRSRLRRRGGPAGDDPQRSARTASRGRRAPSAGSSPTPRHELRSPVATIRALVESDRIIAHPGGHVGLAADVLDETARLTAVVDDLLVLARGDARLPTEHRTVDLSALRPGRGGAAPRRVPVAAAVDDGLQVSGEPGSPVERGAQPARQRRAARHPAGHDRGLLPKDEHGPCRGDRRRAGRAT